jgi:hypothetical protein
MKAVLHQIRGFEIAKDLKFWILSDFLNAVRGGIQASVRDFVGDFITSNSKESSLPRIKFER